MALPNSPAFDRDKRAALRRAALLWVNNERQNLGMPTIAELPLGTCGDPDNCPIANALHGTSSRYEYRASVASDSVMLRYSAALGQELVGVEYGSKPLPTNVREFISEFDLGNYEDLIYEPEEDE